MKVVLTRKQKYYNLKKRIDEYGLLIPGWDGSNGVAPKKEIREQAKLILNQLYEDEDFSYFPHISCTGDQEISFTWRNRDTKGFCYLFVKENVLDVFCSSNGGERILESFEWINPDEPPEIVERFLAMIKLKLIEM